MYKFTFNPDLLIDVNNFYEHRILFFIDILGFSDYSSKPENYKAVAYILNRLQSLGESVDVRIYLPPEKRDTPHLFEYNLLSDTLVMSFPVDFLLTYEKYILEPIICTISAVARSLDMDYPFFRGAIVKGLLYHKDGIIFGPALVEAYNLEKKSAKYPRIIISKELEALFEKKYLETEFIDNINYYVNDEDYYCINIFYESFSYVLYCLHEDGDFYYIGKEGQELYLHAWKERIEKGLKSEHIVKYEYLKKQWNRQVDMFYTNIPRSYWWLFDENNEFVLKIK